MKIFNYKKQFFLFLSLFSLSAITIYILLDIFFLENPSQIWRMISIALFLLFFLLSMTTVFHLTLKKTPLPKTSFDFEHLSKILNAQKTTLFLFEPNTYEVIWTNDSNFFLRFLNTKNYYRLSLSKFLPEKILNQIKKKQKLEGQTVYFKNKKQKTKERFLISLLSENVLILQDEKKQTNLEALFVEQQLIFMLLEVDSGDFILDPDNLLNQQSLQIWAFVDTKLDEILNVYKGWLTSTKPGSFVLLLNNVNFQTLKKEKFAFIKKITDDIYRTFKIRLTFSGGVYVPNPDVEFDDKNSLINDFDHIMHSYQQSARALKTSQTRLGDQITLIDSSGNLKFFGDQTTDQGLPVTDLDKNYWRFLSLLNKYENIFIVGHQNADFDVYGSGLGLKFFLEHYFAQKKKIHFVVQNADNDTKETVEKILTNDQQSYSDLIRSNFLFWRNNKMINLKGKNALIMVDNNQPKNADISALQTKKMNGIFIFDHHVDSFLTRSPVFKLINTHFSSASEIVAFFLKIQEKQSKTFTLPQSVFRLLLLGILVDTNNLQNNIGGQTIKCVNFLLQKGITLSSLIDEITNYRKTFIAQRIESVFVEPKKLILKVFDKSVHRNMAASFAEDYLLKKGVEVIFVVLFDDKKQIFLSARSKINFNVAKVCQQFAGGGSRNRAAAKILDKKVDYVVNKITNFILSNKENNDKNNKVK